MEVFYSVAHLLNLDVDIVLAVTTSTYWEMEVAAELAEAADRDGSEAEDSPSAEEGRCCSVTPRTTATTCPRS